MRAPERTSPTSSTAPAERSASRRPPVIALDPEGVRRLSRTIGNRAVCGLVERRLMRCSHCGNPACASGERCGRDASLGGLFTPGLQARAVGPHRETKQHSKLNQFESEHMVPSAAWKQSGLRHVYDDLPTMSIPYAMHRGAVGGAGLGVTSTGSGGVAAGWSRRLGQLMRQGNMREAIRLAAVDEFNAARHSVGLSEGVVSQIVQVVNLHAARGDITVDDAAAINTQIINAWLNSTGQY